MSSIGDVVLHDIYVGVVTGVDNNILKCACSDGSIKEWDTSYVTCIETYKQVLRCFEEAIIGACR